MVQNESICFGTEDRKTNEQSEKKGSRNTRGYSQCFLLVGYSLPVSECLTLEFMIKKHSSGFTKGTNSASSDLDGKGIGGEAIGHWA